MRVLFLKLSDERHRLDVVRADGSRDGRELETRSFLVHDLAHFAVEEQAGLVDGFWGSLASGVDFDALAVDPNSDDPRWRAERLAAPFQTLWSRRDDGGFAERRAAYIARLGVDDAFVDGAFARMRRMWGQWRATPYRSAMELAWTTT